MSRYRIYLETLLVAVIIASLLRSFVIGSYRVVSQSMAPTLLAGDFLLAYELPFGLRSPGGSIWVSGREPELGEVVIFSLPQSPDNSLVKRLAGRAGDEVMVRSGIVLVNGVAQSWGGEPGAASTVTNKDNDFGPVVVPPDHVFLLSEDLRGAPDDSRRWGAVPKEKVRALVVWIWFSVGSSPSGGIELRWDRVGAVSTRNHFTAPVNVPQ